MYIKSELERESSVTLKSFQSTMAPQYKLIYFNGKGAGECTRYLFKYGGIEFKDVRYTMEEWPQIKSKTTFGQLPVLEHQGKQVNQSIAIARYVAKLVKLAGNDDWENAEIDAIVDTLNDLRLKLTLVHFEKDETKKKTLRETALKETLPYYLSRLEAIAKKNNGHLALGRLTWADFFLTTLTQSLDTFVGANTFEQYPTLQAVQDEVNALPAVKKWIQERPKSEF